MQKTIQKLPIGVQSFELLRKNNYVYVDKSKHIYELAQGIPRYFLSRPRRFGKSLLCATFQVLFEGKKELFDGLWIQNSDWEWKQYPIIYLDFASIRHETSQDLKLRLLTRLREIADDQDIKYPEDYVPEELLVLLVKKMSEISQVVILIDEYDKPILDYLANSDSAKAMRETLRSFYTTIKSLDHYLRFVFITGVTKFSRTSIFSGMNNLEDLSFTKQAATLCGYTQTEIVNNFDQHLDLFAQEQQITKKELLAEIQKWYDGYRFYEKTTTAEHIYNPFSVLLSLKHKAFKNYWFDTGTPTFLINLIKEKKYPVIEIENAKLNESALSSFDIEKINLLTLLLQTGYLTISDYIPQEQNYVLVCPNQEVRFSLSKHIIEDMTHMSMTQFNAFIDQFRKALVQSNLDQFCQILQKFLILVPCTIRIPLEKYYHSLFFVIVRLFIADVFVEEATSIGYIDAVIQTPTHIFIIEFKYGGTPEKALQQIKEREYCEKYALQNPDKKIMQAGIVFDLKSKKLVMGWKVQDYLPV